MADGVDACVAAIKAKGDSIRELKSSKAPKDQVMAQVQELIALKADYLNLTGSEYVVPKAPSTKKKAKEVTPPPPSTTSDPNKKSKKQLNKEKKKAAKQAKAAEGKSATTKSSSTSDDKKAKTAPKAAPSSSADGIAKSVVRATKLKLDPSRKKLGISYNSSDLPLVSYVVAKLLDSASNDELFEPSDNPSEGLAVLLLPEQQYVTGDFSIARYLARQHPSAGLYGHDDISTSKVDSWIDYALLNSKSPSTLALMLSEHLATRSFIIGNALSLADIALWATFVSSRTEKDLPLQVERWFNHLNSQSVFASAKKFLESKLPKTKNNTTSGGDKKTNRQCPPLEGAVDGQVVTRFPPEPSGYLHIGHVKACMLNNYYAKHYNGKLIVRFDDTNPSKEKAEFEESILADLKKLSITPDIVTYTSDSFPLILSYAHQMIADGNAYMDNTSQEQMREERMEGIDSVNRNMDVKTTRALFDKMCANAPEAGGYCLRAKIDMQSKNKTMRDPVLYRVNVDTPHHRTGTTYKAYPTYDFACPIVDSVEGVTHALRTTEYNDRDFQYAWIINALSLRPVKIQSFARMNFMYSVLSKRKLQWFVDQKHVSGWNDPRFPTVQGVLRRGVQVSALTEFILSQGASRRIVDMQWDKFWSINKKVIDPIAPRFFALSKNESVPLTLTNVDSSKILGLPIAFFPKAPEKGNKIMRFGAKLLVEGDDAAGMKEGEEITLMRYGNVILEKVIRGGESGQEVVALEGKANPTGDFKKTKKKITWLANVPDLVPVKLMEFDHLISKPKLEENDDFKDFMTPVTEASTMAVGDHCMRNVKKGDIIQLERRGFYRVDSPYISEAKPLVLFMIPDGKEKAMSTLSTKLSHR